MLTWIDRPAVVIGDELAAEVSAFLEAGIRRHAAMGGRRPSPDVEHLRYVLDVAAKRGASAISSTASGSTSGARAGDSSTSALDGGTLSVSETAKMLGSSRSWVRGVAAERFGGRKVGRDWRLDRAKVEEEQWRRSRSRR